ncbi:hypothetical protein MMC28_005616 [Mycoblastus sanguinarius]|nr:hypothetical protein [Mycoblastus sanguinarius]
MVQNDPTLHQSLISEQTSTNPIPSLLSVPLPTTNLQALPPLLRIPANLSLPPARIATIAIALQPAHNTHACNITEQASKQQHGSNDGSWTPRGLAPSFGTNRDAPVSPTRSSSVATAIALPSQSQFINGGRTHVNGDALSKLPASQVREMREGFQILDRDNDGLVNRDDVVDMLTNLGSRAIFLSPLLLESIYGTQHR